MYARGHAMYSIMSLIKHVGMLSDPMGQTLCMFFIVCKLFRYLHAQV